MQRFRKLIPDEAEEDIRSIDVRIFWSFMRAGMGYTVEEILDMRLGDVFVELLGDDSAE